MARAKTPKRTKTSAAANGRAPKKTAQPLTTAQRLGSLVKSARDIMRKDKGLNGDLDRLPMLTWLLFLEFLDDHEAIREERSRMKREKYRPVIDPPYRWRDWAAQEDGISGDALRAFVNHEEVKRPDGKKAPGLIAYLRGLQGSNGDDRRDVVASVFSGVTNRMESGYLMRDVTNKVGGIHFDSTEEIHTFGHLCQMNLLLHGLESPQIVKANSLAQRLTEIKDSGRTGPTEHVWYYEQPLPAGRKNYTKTAPLQYEELAECLAWWPQRKETERAWRVPVEKILENNCNLDLKNPNAADDFQHLPPEQLVEDILQKELRIVEFMREIKELLKEKP